MSESLMQTVSAAQVDLDELGRAITARRWGDAGERARKLLSHVSKLHQRLSAAAQLVAEDAFAAAEVDRALDRAAKHHQTTIEEQVADLEKKRARKPRGKA